MRKALVFWKQRIRILVLPGSSVLHFSCGGDVRFGSACARRKFARVVKGRIQDPLQVAARGFDTRSWRAACVFHRKRSDFMAQWETVSLVNESS